MKSCDILIKWGWGDIGDRVFKYISYAFIVGWLYVFVKVKYSVYLGVCGAVVRIVFIVKIEEHIFRIIPASKRVVRE